jgi:hypothetical protein
MKFKMTVENNSDILTVCKFINTAYRLHESKFIVSSIESLKDSFNAILMSVRFKVDGNDDSIEFIHAGLNNDLKGYKLLSQLNLNNKDEALAWFKLVSCILKYFDDIQDSLYKDYILDDETETRLIAFLEHNKLSKIRSNPNILGEIYEAVVKCRI